MRLDKYLADMGLGSRSELKNIIRAGRVSVDGVTVTAPDTRVEEQSAVALDGRSLKYSKYRYFMLNKPAGVLSATEDGRQNTVLELFPPELRRLGLFPVGRLDKDTEGLLLMTNDGEWAHRVISPSSGIEKRYFAVTEGVPDEEDVRAFAEGLVLRDGLRCLPAVLEINGDNSCYVTVMEGKYHQVKRMLASRGKTVLKLKRLSIGALTLDEKLLPGQFKELSEEEKSAVLVTKLHKNG